MTPPANGDVVVTDSCVTIVIERLAEAVCWGLPESFTITFAVLVPVAMGAPLIAPVLALIVNPEGKLVADHVRGAVPPVVVTLVV